MLLSVTVACPTRLICCQVCGQPLSHWPQICKPQREERSWSKSSWNVFSHLPERCHPSPSAGTAPLLRTWGSKMKGDVIKTEPGAGKAKPWGLGSLTWVLVPHVLCRVVPRVKFGFLQMFQITQGVHVCVVFAHVLGKREPWPMMLVVHSEGKSSEMGETSSGIASMPHLGRRFDPAPGARAELIAMDGLDASLHPFLHQL